MCNFTAALSPSIALGHPWESEDFGQSYRIIVIVNGVCLALFLAGIAIHAAQLAGALQLGASIRTLIAGIVVLGACSLASLYIIKIAVDTKKRMLDLIPGQISFNPPCFFDLKDYVAYSNTMNLQNEAQHRFNIELGMTTGTVAALIIVLFILSIVALSVGIWGCVHRVAPLCVSPKIYGTCFAVFVLGIGGCIVAIRKAEIYFSRI